MICIIFMGFSAGYGYGVSQCYYKTVMAAQVLLDIELNPLAVQEVIHKYPEVLWVIPEILDMDIKIPEYTFDPEHGCRPVMESINLTKWEADMQALIPE